ncbi:unnamed protein product [Discosporangium mesarthrocarpum]
MRERQERRGRAREERNVGEGADGEESAGAGALGGPGAGVGAKKTLSCNTCGMSFEGTGPYREHFKTDLHRYNLKLKLKGLQSLSEEEFSLVDAEAFFLSDRH